MFKKLFIVILLLSLTFFGLTQNHMQGSIQRGSSKNKIDILFLPGRSNTDEYVNYLSISVAVPLAEDISGAAPTIVGVGTFASMNFTSIAAVTVAKERIYSWISVNPGSTSMSWTKGVSFIGATITFGADLSHAKLIDFSNTGGGAYGNSYFSVITNIGTFDVTNYSALFFEITGENPSKGGKDESGNQYVEMGSAKPNIPILWVDTPTTCKIFPNPSSSKVSFAIESVKSDRVAIVVIETSGKVVKQQNTAIEAGKNILSLDIDEMAKGVYILKAVCQKNNQVVLGKFIKY